MNTKDNNPYCPLCGSGDLDLFFEDQKRIYLHCLYCQLVFVPKNFWLGSKEERAIYDLHENDSQDQGYRQFLARLSTPLLEKLGSGQNGLDFGCGPGPTLSVILEEQGQQVDLYDPFYYNNSSVFSKSYDFICSTEVVEHLHNPDKEFTALFKILKPCGWMGIMTKLPGDLLRNVEDREHGNELDQPCLRDADERWGFAVSSFILGHLPALSDHGDDSRLSEGC